MSFSPCSVLRAVVLKNVGVGGTKNNFVLYLDFSGKGPATQQMLKVTFRVLGTKPDDTLLPQCATQRSWPELPLQAEH